MYAHAQNPCIMGSCMAVRQRRRVASGDVIFAYIVRNANLMGHGVPLAIISSDTGSANVEIWRDLPGFAVLGF